MTKPVLFRLTKTMMKLIKVYYINTLEIGGGGGLTSTFYAFGIFYNFQFHSAYIAHMTKPVLFRLTKTMMKLIKVHYINILEIGGGAYLHFLCIWYIL